MLYYLRQFDWIMIAASCMLTVLGIVTLYSLSHGDPSYTFNLYKQIAFFIVGLGVMVLMGLFDYRIIKRNSILVFAFYIITVGLLLGLFLFAPEIKGAKRWYALSFFTLDPFELTKIAVLLVLAKYFAFRHIEIYRLRHLVQSGIYVAIPAVLVFVQPDFGSVVLLGGLWILIMMIAGMNRKQFFTLLVMGVVCVGILWGGFLKDYQKERILNFLDQERDPLGGGYSVLQANIAVGSAGVFGRGWLNGPQVQYGFLPEPHTDFVFAAFVHEWGFVGAVLTIVLFFILFLRIMYAALSARNNFSRFVASGVVFIFILQVAVNIGMNIGILPVMGVSLPFMSYGGSSLISSFILVGFLQSIRIHTPKLESAEFNKEE